MADTNVQILADRADIVAVADAVRAKTGTTEALTLGGMVTAIEDINVGSDPVLQNKTVTPTTSKQTVTADSGYDGLDTVTVNAMPTATQATPSISVNSSGLITASATQTAGYVAAGTKSATKQLTTQAAKTITPSTSSQTAVASGRYTTGAVTVAAIPSTYVKPTATKAATTYTPSTSNQTIAAGTYCSGAQTIKGDANLKAANIAEGVSIFGVTGTHSGVEDLDAELTTQESLIAELSSILDTKASGGGGIDTSDATATAETIFKDESAYVDGEKVIGTFTIDSELTTQDSLITQIQTALQNKAAGSEPVLQSKTVTPSTSSQTVKPDSGYDGLSQVTVNAMTTATQATPTVSIDSAGKITATATQTAGYVAAGTKTGTKQMTTQAAKTITPSTSSQTAVAKNVYTTGVVTVGAIPSTYVKPTTTKSATTYTPTTSNQTIAAGTYCSGAQTIKGDSNLVAGNIKNGVSIFGVTGSYAGSGGSSGGEDGPSRPSEGGPTEDPSASLPTVSSGFVSSTAEGSIIYPVIIDGSITTSQNTLIYMSVLKKYRHPLDAALLANTPIIVLTSGTITMPPATGYTCETIATGTGYGVYQYVPS